ncbi:MAG: substrate-binding domain-containing protein [Promethearchaeota archaeon]
MKLLSKNYMKYTIIPVLALVIFMSGCTQAGDKIVVIGRPSTSGTRGTFDELVLDEENPTAKMEEQESNTLVHDRVSDTKYAIGYVGLGYVDKDVKALEIDGELPSEATILDGSYPISRGLNLFTNGEPTGTIKDFIDFIMSKEGQDIVEDEGFIQINKSAAKYNASGDVSLLPSTKLSLKGSTTVLPIANASAIEYMKIQTNIQISVSGGGSGQGIEAIGKEEVSIGMASRELKQEEIDNYPDLVKTVIANDGIAVIVHPDNDVIGISLETLKGIYLGDFTTWSEVKDEMGTTVKE